MAVKKAPFNISILEPVSYIKDRAMLPVSSVLIYESSSTRMHPDGLFSEVIFGNIGVSERIVRKGFINLNTKVFTPHLFKQILTLKKFYIDIISGRAYAYFDEENKDLVLSTPEDPKANTGFSFFMKTYPKIEFKYTESIQRRDKIDLLKKFHNEVFIDKLVVMAAGLRDIRESNGRMQIEDINKLYSSIITLANSLDKESDNDPVFDSVRYQIQMKIMDIYKYVSDVIDGKGGFSQKRYSARNVAYATRNVITAANISGVDSPEASNAFGMGSIQVPLYQVMKSYSPLVIHSLRRSFFDNVFPQQNLNIALIDPNTLRLNYYTVTPSAIKHYTTEVNEFINNYRNPEIHHEPVDVEVVGLKVRPYLYLLYDTGDVIVPFRNIDDLKELYQGDINEKYIRPMTYSDMAYIAAYQAINGKYATSTRHPVLNMQGNDVYKVHITTTTKSRIVQIRNIAGMDNIDSPGIVLPEYPVFSMPIKQSMSVHTAVLSSLDGDHDGDTMALIGVMTDEANQEIAEYQNKISSMVDTRGNLIQGLASGRNVKLQLYATSCGKL